MLLSGWRFSTVAANLQIRDLKWRLSLGIPMQQSQTTTVHRHGYAPTKAAFLRVLDSGRVCSSCSISFKEEALRLSRQIESETELALLFKLTRRSLPVDTLAISNLFEKLVKLMERDAGDVCPSNYLHRNKQDFLGKKARLHREQDNLEGFR